MSVEPIEAPLPASDALTLSDLNSLRGLSVRVFNVCGKNELRTLGDIRRFKRVKRDFLELSGCGKKTALELEDLLEKVGYEAPEQEARTEGGQHLPDPAAVDEPAAVAAIIDQWAMLSVRARNVLEQFAESVEPHDLYRTLMDCDFNLPKLRNSGIKTQTELEQFALAIKGCEGTVQVVGKTAPFVISHLSNVLRAHFTSAEVLDIKPAELVDAHDQVNVFALLDRIADLHRANPAVPWRVFETFAVQPGYHGTAAELAARMKVTRERVRQIELQLCKLLRSHFGFLGELELPEVLRPMVDQRNPVVVIPPDMVEDVNRTGSARWSAWFIAQVTDLMTRGQLMHIGWKQMGLNGQQARELDHHAPLLVAAHLSEDLTQASTTLVELLDRPRSTDEAVVIGELLPDGRKELLDEMEIALRVLLPFLSPGIACEPGTCILPANRKRRIEDLLEEVLVEYDQPTHARTLVDRLRIMHPDRDWTIESIRSLVVRFKDRFISFGRTSTYGLRRWEKDKEDIKGGTIRDIAYELLQAQAMPLHLEDLTARIQRFRPTTNGASVRLNLQMDLDSRFVFFPNGFIGRSGKEYERAPEPIKRVPSSLFRISVLRRFVGSPLTELVSFLEQRSAVEATRIRTLLDKKVMDGTIVLGEGERITAIVQEKPADTSEPSGTDAVGELPFDWGDE